MHALVVTYCLAHEADPVEHAELREQLAPALAAMPGLASKTWLANDATGRYGGFYLFETRSACERFVASELYGALHSDGVLHDVVASDFAIDARATAVTRGLDGLQ